MGGLRDEEAEIFREGNIPMVMDGAECVKGLGALITFGAMVERMRKEKCALPFTLKTGEIRRLVKMYNRKLFSEHDSKEVLARCGIPVTEERLANSVEKAIQYAGQIGYPVVLKVDSPDIAHKTEAGGVRAGISDHVALMEAYTDIVLKVKAYNPGARINGILVQEQITGSREVIVRMLRDSQFGPTIIFGLGGILVEVLQDVSLRVPPLSRADAIDMINGVKGRKILAPFRGKPEADIEGIADVLLKLSRLAIDLRDMILEIDINPLIVRDKGEGVKVADALIVLQ